MQRDCAFRDIEPGTRFVATYGKYRKRRAKRKRARSDTAYDERISDKRIFRKADYHCRTDILVVDIDRMTDTFALVRH